MSGCSSLSVDRRSLCWRMGERSLLVAVSSVGTELWPDGFRGFLSMLSCDPDVSLPLSRSSAKGLSNWTGRTTELVLALPRALVFELPKLNWSCPDAGTASLDVC